MNKRFLALIIAMTMVFSLAVPAFAGNEKVTNNYLEGAELKQDFNNAQFHCNAISGNGRVWPVVPADMKKFEGQLTFTKAAGTQWNLTGVAEQKKDDKGKALTGQYNKLGMVVCPVCGSIKWITFSNNSGVPDGKNVQMQHPGENFTIVKEWEKNNEPYADGVRFYANFKITLENGNIFKVGPGKYFLPEGFTATVEETTRTDGFDPVQIILNGADVAIGPVGNIKGGDVLKFINADKPVFSGDGQIRILKLLQIGNAEAEIWNTEHPFFADDNEYIFFDLYKANEDLDGTVGKLLKTTNVNPLTGMIEFNELVAGTWYCIVERLEFPVGHERADKYELIEPIFVQATKITEVGGGDGFIQDDFTGSGIYTRRTAVISTNQDDELIMYDCLDNFNTYFGIGIPKTPSIKDIKVIDDSIMALNDISIRQFWMAEMQKDNMNWFDTIDKIKLLDKDENIIATPQFIWNTDNFTNQDRAYSGDTIIFEKEFELLDKFVDKDGNELANGVEIPFYITADNGFIVYVNGKYVGHSDAFGANWTKVPLDANELEAVIDNRGNQFLPNASETWSWSYVYTFDIRNYLNLGVKNVITIIAVNQSEIGTDRDYYNNPKINPAGVIFGCEIYSASKNYRIINKLPGEPVVLSKIVSIYKVATDAKGVPYDAADVDATFKFILSKKNALGEWDNIGNVLPAVAGLNIYFEIANLDFGKDYDEGSYRISEIDVPKSWKQVNYKPYVELLVTAEVNGNVTTFIVDVKDFNDNRFVNDDEVVFINQERELKVVKDFDKIPSHSHEMRWEDFGITCLFGDMKAGNDVWNTQFFGENFWAVNDAVVITFKIGGDEYNIAVVVDQKTADALPKYSNLKVIFVKDLKSIDGNPGFWFKDIYPGLSGGGMAELVEVFQWK